LKKKKYLKPRIKEKKIRMSFFRRPSRELEEFEGLFLADRSLYDG